MSEENKLLIDQLSSEYKILQDKIDKIGAFRFTIRGWSVTLVVASIFAVGSSRSVSPLLLLLLLLFVLLFFSIERKQNKHQTSFENRAFQIEKEIWRIVRPRLAVGTRRQDIGFSPRIAHHLSDVARRSTPSGRFAKLRKRFMDPDQLFYVAQVAAIVIAVAALMHGRVGSSEPQRFSPVSVFEYHNQENMSPEKSGEKPVAKNEKAKNTKAGLH